MGTTKVTALISNLAKTRLGYKALFRVDTGAIHCMAPKDLLKKAGIKAEGRATCESSDGKPYEMEYGFARISFLGKETVVQIIFGPEKAEPVLGLVALENAGIRVNPFTMTLKKMPVIPLEIVDCEWQ
jgi:clan AA aspartic protease